MIHLNPILGPGCYSGGSRRDHPRLLPPCANPRHNANGYSSPTTYDSLHALQLSYYEQARFAEVFARAKRAPLHVAQPLRAIPGVAAAETTVSFDVLLDVPDVVEAVTGRIIALPDGGNPPVNRLTLIAGRWIAMAGSNEALVNEQFSHRALTQEINEQRVFGVVLPSIFLGVAVFLLNVVLTRQIGTQRSQIAALKALGCPDAQIGVHYLKFVLVIVALGIAIGLVIGAWLGRSMTHMYAVFFRFPSLEYRLEAWIPLTASAATFLGAMLGGVQALVAVVRLPPAEAMRPPSPPSFRATLLERVGYGDLYSPQTRMILRNIERLPLRYGMTAFAIACGVAILISGTWWRDARRLPARYRVPAARTPACQRRVHRSCLHGGRLRADAPARRAEGRRRARSAGAAASRPPRTPHDARRASCCLGDASAPG